jgi:phosphatidylserine/phosphatidylglycerophosphate/cardiolipin synthase-like enzyme
MSVTLKVYANEDDALLFWSIPKPIPGCRGFAIERKRRRANQPDERKFLDNRVGFENQKTVAKTEKGQPAVVKPSTEWPFQRFSWTDHDANTGEAVSYRVVPVLRKAEGELVLDKKNASAFSDEKILGNAPDARFAPFFNRGFIISQFMSRFLAENGLDFNKKTDMTKFKQALGKHETKIRQFLSGDLRVALLDLLESARKDGREVFGALFELSDDELIEALTRFGSKAHIVLSNGSITAAKGEGSAAARKRDENEDARKTLRAAKVDVVTKDRFISPGALGHNKFLVITGKGNKPAIVWTGSTNWAPTGLCTQVNNGLLIRDAAVAKIYREQWQRLRDAKSAFEGLAAANTTPKQIGDDVTVWFSRTSKGVDLEALQAEVKNAKEGILFLMFMPGSAGLFSTVAAQSGNPKLYVRGVATELPNGQADASVADINLIEGPKHTPLHFDVIQAQGLKNPMANFVAEVTHNQFVANIGHAIIHSKVLVIDPFSDHPVVIAGSHNFSIAASQKNDENFIIIKGDRELAEAYAVNVMGAFAHYQWRAHIGQTKKPFNGLHDDDKWQAPKLAREESELRFWGV